MDEDNRLIEERKKKLDFLREHSIKPWGERFKKTHEASEVLENFGKLKKEEHSKKSVTIAGRIVGKRVMGKASFAHVLDWSGKIQLFLTRDTLEDDYQVFKKMDIGDIIGVKGEVFKTKTGEVTIDVKKLTFLTKSLRPLPEKFHGLKDKELRYRQRYVDLIMNPEVRETFIKRTKIIQSIRSTLDNEGFLEVETPTLQPIYGGASARPFETMHNALKMKLYMRISDELYLKRLIVGGFEKVYEICKDFRNEGIDKTHNPEFTMIEWYQAYGDYEDGMNLVEKVVKNAAKSVLGTTKVKYENKTIDLKTPWTRMTMAEAIKKYACIDVLNMSREELIEYCDKNSIEYDNSSWGMLTAAVFEVKCEEHLIQPTFILDHPVETTPLAKPHRSGDERLVERFELFINGWECGNAYSELNDPILQKKFLQDQVDRGRGGEDETQPMDEDYVHALEIGMPPTSGVGLGIDRLVMLMTGAQTIRDVILFPTLKSQE